MRRALAGAAVKEVSDIAGGSRTRRFRTRRFRTGGFRTGGSKAEAIPLHTGPARAWSRAHAAVPRKASATPKPSARTAEEIEAVIREFEGRRTSPVASTSLYAPTLRIKRLAAPPGPDTYAQALCGLFKIDPHAVEAVAGSEFPPLENIT